MTCHGGARSHLKVEGRKWCASILRSASQGPFAPADASRLADVAPHLDRAASLASKFALAYELGAVEALERIGRAAFVIDRAGLIVAANTLAEQCARPDLAVVRNRLRAADSASDRRLQALIAQAVAPRAPGDRASAAPFSSHGVKAGRT